MRQSDSTSSFAKTTLAVKEFAERWTNRGYEKGESQKFWMELLHDVLGAENPGNMISFENQVKLSNTGFIDAYIEPTKVLIEQKSIDKDLHKAVKQSDGSFLTPYEQAKRYASELPVSKHPRWVVTCNFKSFLTYDMEKPHDDPEEILLENLEKEYHRLRFLVDDRKALTQKEFEVSIKAGELVGKLYDAFLAQYGNKVSPEDLHSLNVLCVRLVFCLYAEDAGIFSKDQFYWYMIQFKPDQMRSALKELFAVLDTKAEERDRFIPDALSAFPYVNGSLFHQLPSEDIPRFTQEIADILLPKASLGFDWSDISPTIFGAVFESTLNPATRREGGMHYTSIENIHKVIDPLFLDGLKAEFEQIKQEKQDNKRQQKCDQFQDKLASFKFLDPACGSGNFLTETYISLRTLENEVISLKLKGQKLLGIEQFNPIKVSIRQFYGIEINDFAVIVAMTALWIAESQMMHKTEQIIKFDLDYLPLKIFTNIHRANALRMDWGLLLTGNPGGNHAKFDYIMGNPPFVGKSYQTKEQKEDMQAVFDGVKNYGNLDYVASWYKRCGEYVKGTHTACAFVSTNSICQGIAVPPLWNWMFENNMTIDFAYPTFKWNSEAKDNAAVCCVIIGFSDNIAKRPKHIFANQIAVPAENINAYLLNAPNIIVENRATPLCNVPPMIVGSCPTDGGGFIIEASEYGDFVKQEPRAAAYIHLYIGAEEFIHGKNRYCLWLKDCPFSELQKMPKVLDRVKLVKEFRLASKKEQTKRRADAPTRFAEDRYVPKVSLIIPMVSSENRRYVPMGFIPSETVASNLASVIPECSIYLFGIITSRVSMAWMRVVGSRLKSDYRYSASLVYNTFPFPTPTDAQTAKIEMTAQAILDARALHPDCSLDMLYNEVTMPQELRKAHEANDNAVTDAYGFKRNMTEPEIVAELFKMYKELLDAENEKQPARKTVRRKK